MFIHITKARRSNQGTVYCHKPAGGHGTEDAQATGLAVPSQLNKQANQKGKS